MLTPRPGGATRVLRALRNVVFAALALAIGFSVIGYVVGVPLVRSPVDGLVYDATGLFVKPVQADVATATSSAQASGHGPRNLLDGSEDYWAAPTGKLPVTLQFTFSKAVDLTSIVIVAHPKDDRDGVPKAVWIVLPDGRTIEKTVSADLSASGSDAHADIQVGARGVKTVRLVIVSVDPAESGEVAIAEVRFYRRP